GETPGPIPNPEVKPLSADGTARGTVWETRTSPHIYTSRSILSGIGLEVFLRPFSGRRIGAVRPVPVGRPTTPRCLSKDLTLSRLAAHPESVDGPESVGRPQRDPSLSAGLVVGAARGPGPRYADRGYADRAGVPGVRLGFAA